MVLTSYSPIPGTKDYNLLLEKKIIPKDLDPLWHNNTIFAELISPGYVGQVRKLRHLVAKINKLA